MVGLSGEDKAAILSSPYVTLAQCEFLQYTLRAERDVGYLPLTIA
jgi:hypothetical protein